MNISIGNDHAGPKYKKEIILFLEKKGYSVVNHGTNNDQSVDYPDFIHPVAHDVSSKKADFGIIICGSGNGAALCWSEEIAKLAKQHNNANILSLPARFISISQAIEMVDVFIKTEFDGGRHQKRIKKIPHNK